MKTLLEFRADLFFFFADLQARWYGDEVGALRAGGGQGRKLKIRRKLFKYKTLNFGQIKIKPVSLSQTEEKNILERNNTNEVVSRLNSKYICNHKLFSCTIL